MLRSDVVRKRALGASEQAHLDPATYSPAASERVYGALWRLARVALEAGQSVVVDAVHAKPAERAAVARVARGLGVSFTGLWLEAPESVLLGRVVARRGDASDATAAVVRQQLAYETGEVTWHRLDASATPDALAATAQSVLPG